ncbi:unnamed protein product, partial [Mycena citricolor]
RIRANRECRSSILDWRNRVQGWHPLSSAFAYIHDGCVSSHLGDGPHLSAHRLISSGVISCGALNRVIVSYTQNIEPVCRSP